MPPECTRCEVIGTLTRTRAWLGIYVVCTCTIHLPIHSRHKHIFLAQHILRIIYSVYSHANIVWVQSVSVTGDMLAVVLLWMLSAKAARESAFLHTRGKACVHTKIIIHKSWLWQEYGQIQSILALCVPFALAGAIHTRRDSRHSDRDSRFLSAHRPGSRVAKRMAWHGIILSHRRRINCDGETHVHACRRFVRAKRDRRHAMARAQRKLDASVTTHSLSGCTLAARGVHRQVTIHTQTHTQLCAQNRALRTRLRTCDTTTKSPHGVIGGGRGRVRNANAIANGANVWLQHT